MPPHLVIMYGIGGLSDVGRHAVRAALDYGPDVTCTVITKHPHLLDESNWNCGCVEPHKFTDDEKARLEIVPVDEASNWEDTDLTKYMKNATAIISCTGNRQPFIGGWDAQQSTETAIRAMKKSGTVNRLVTLSSVGIEEDWPPLEFHWTGKVLALLFMTFSRQSFRDLTLMERAIRSSDLDFLIVRPVGIGEDIAPVAKWHLQKQKYADKSLFFNMAKLDVARYMVLEAIESKTSKSAVVIGAEQADCEVKS